MATASARTAHSHWWGEGHSTSNLAMYWTSTGRLAGEPGAFMTLLPGWRMRELFGSPADGSPWRARRGAASDSCSPGC